jgi:uncharacterized coiled-coil protein SlyX
MTDTANVVLSEEMKVELGASLAALVNGQVKLQRIVALQDARSAQQDSKIAQQDAKIAQQDAKIGRLIDQIALLTKLLDSHQSELEILKIREQGGIVQ